MAEVREPPPETIEHLGTMWVGGEMQVDRVRFEFVERRVWAGAVAAYYREMVDDEPTRDG